MNWIKKKSLYLQRYWEDTMRPSLRSLASYSQHLVPMAVTWHWLNSDVTLGIEDVQISLTPFCGAACHILQLSAALFWPRDHRKVKHKSTCNFLQSVWYHMSESTKSLSFISSVHLKELRGKSFYLCTVHSDMCRVHSPTNALLLI